ncbi:dockerin type I repeat-containing protein [Aeoliella mucimassa]|uniref:Dockerin domain-containing protein n=1 Tax=Aeoliella mucimassa TaxID=2527972 RepID=A0A518AJD8_9BACT|nr:dockerin type I repeat-containing protein [Aeoliella mucimassa]QDU54835.1 hypothetical protein Pan181_10180 [Aeoliella mucimassa]
MRNLCYAALFAMVVEVTPLHASIYGTMSNFDTYNETEFEAYGAEIELEDIHLGDLSRTFPSNYDSEVITEYNDGNLFGTRIVYSGYNFDNSGFLAPTVGQSTNGHACVATAGCEHFGFSVVGNQPTAARFYWLDADGNRIGNQPAPIPMPTWNYMPGVNGAPNRLQAEVEVEVIEQQPDSIWMKVYKTEIERAVDLAELMSDNGIVPDSIGETETEWELLEGGVMDAAEDELGDGVHAVIRRYEYYEYTGPYDEEHEPTSIFLDQDLPEPPEGELGQFIAANMVAANLEAPARTHGDFNGDGKVDLADYTVWRDSLGSELEYEADANDDGMIDSDDYSVWRTNYGRGIADNAAAVNAVPEPSALAMVLLGGAALLTLRHRTKRRSNSPTLVYLPS